MFFWIVLWTLKTIKLRTLFQRHQQLQRYHTISNNNTLSYVIRQEERLALKDRSLTTDKELAWFEPTIINVVYVKLSSLILICWATFYYRIDCCQVARRALVLLELWASIATTTDHQKPGHLGHLAGFAFSKTAVYLGCNLSIILRFTSNQEDWCCWASSWHLYYWCHANLWGTTGLSSLISFFIKSHIGAKLPLLWRMGENCPTEPTKFCHSCCATVNGRFPSYFRFFNWLSEQVYVSAAL